MQMQKAIVVVFGSLFLAFSGFAGVYGSVSPSAQAAATASPQDQAYDAAIVGVNG
jgi:hypothetical protein